MILTLLDVVLPVFLVLGAGYLATRSGLFKSSAVDGLMVFTQNFAIPCLLFRATATMDFSADLDGRLLISFYLGAITAFALGIFGARILFGRRPGEAVAIGFAALYSNSVLLGLPIMERAFGAEALAPNFAIIAFHAPFCYIVGITFMELTRADGRSLPQTAALISKSLIKNALMIGIALGFAVNLLKIGVPSQITGSIDMMIDAALPAAIFGLGGVLTRYRVRDNLGQVAMLGLLSLVIHPAIAYFLSSIVFDLPIGMVRAAVLTAAMAPGANTYIFAAMYDRAKGVNSSAVLLLTLISILTASFWLTLLP